MMVYFSRKWLFLLLLFFWQKGLSQVVALGIGEQVPYFVINDVINYRANNITSNDLKGKLVVFDFWNTNCGGCISAMPKIEKLNRLFVDSLLIIPVSRQSKEEIKAFWKKNKYVKDLTIPLVTADSFLSQMFEHDGVPHLVWIGQDMKVKALTNSEYLTEDNVRKLLHSDTVNWLVNKPEIDYRYKESILRPDVDEIIGSYTVFSGNLEYVHGNITCIVDSVKRIKRISIINQGISSIFNRLIKYRYTDIALIKRILLNVKDSSRFIMNISKTYSDVWKRTNTYCVEGQANLDVTDSIFFDRILYGFANYAGVAVSFVRKQISCMILCKPQILSNQILDHANNVSLMKVTGYDFIKYINALSPPLPFYADSAMLNSIIEVPKEISEFDNLSKLEKFIKAMGYVIQQENREFEFLLVEDTFPVPLTKLNISE